MKIKEFWGSLRKILTKRNAVKRRYLRMLLGRQLRSETQRRIKVGALCVLLAAFAWLALSAAVFMGVVGTALLTFVIWKLSKEKRTADDSIPEEHTPEIRRQHFALQKTGGISHLESLVLGAGMSITIGSLLVFGMDTMGVFQFPEERAQIAYPVLVGAISFYLFWKGLFDTEPNHASVPAWLNTRFIETFYVHHGKGWMPWFLGFAPYKGSTPEQSARGENVPQGQFYVGNRNITREDTYGTKGKPPSVPARDEIETRIPFSVVYEIVNPVAWQRTNDGHVVLRNRMLETVRLAAGKFHFNDLLFMRSLVSGLMRGEHYVLVMRVKRSVLGDEDRHLERRVITDEHGNRFFRTMHVSRLDKDLEQEKKKLLETVNKGGGRFVPKKKDADGNDTDESALTLEDVEVLYVADGLINVMKQTGTYVSTVQVVDITPEDTSIFAAAAQIEVEMRQRHSEQIEAETRILVAKQFAEKLEGVTEKEALEFARIDAGVSREVFIRGDSSGMDRLAATGYLHLDNNNGGES